MFVNIKYYTINKVFIFLINNPYTLFKYGFFSRVCGQLEKNSARRNYKRKYMFT